MLAGGVVFWLCGMLGRYSRCTVLYSQDLSSGRDPLTLVTLCSSIEVDVGSGLN
jgi:hypothetical protein